MTRAALSAGSHVYYEATKAANKEHGVTDRTIALSRDNGPNWRTENPAEQCMCGEGADST